MSNYTFSPDHYDDHGNPRGFALFWFVSAFILRPWLLFIMAGVSREQGSELLSFFYPDKDILYQALGFSLPVLGLVFLVGSLNRVADWLKYYWRKGRWILLGCLSVDLFFQIQALIQTHWQFKTPVAICLLLTLWIICYLLLSKRIKWLFQIENNSDQQIKNHIQIKNNQDDESK